MVGGFRPMASNTPVLEERGDRSPLVQKAREKNAVNPRAVPTTGQGRCRRIQVPLGPPTFTFIPPNPRNTHPALIVDFGKRKGGSSANWRGKLCTMPSAACRVLAWRTCAFSYLRLRHNTRRNDLNREGLGRLLHRPYARARHVHRCRHQGRGRRVFGTKVKAVFWSPWQRKCPNPRNHRVPSDLQGERRYRGWPRLVW